MKLIKLSLIFLFASSISYSQTITINFKRVDAFKHLVDSVISNNLTDNFEYKGKPVIIRESPKYKRPKSGFLYEVLFDKMYAFFSTDKDGLTKMEFFFEKKTYNGKMEKLSDKKYANNNYYIEEVTDNNKFFYIKCENQKYDYEIEKRKYIITADKGVKLEIEIEYTINELGCMKNDCEAQYSVTNIGKVPYKWQVNTKTKIVFEFTTTDGKIIEQNDSFYQNLEPGRTAPIEKVSISSGRRGICKSVKPVRMEE